MNSQTLSGGAPEQVQAILVCGCSEPAASDVQARSDTITLSRRYIEQLHRHLNLVYGRFPNRHLRQSLRIVQHILGATEVAF